MQQLILLQYVEALGRPGMLVKVRDGYALNYLIPQKLAVRATTDNLKKLTRLREKFEAEEKERVSVARSLGEKLTGFALTIAMKASPEGKLYGSVTPTTIVEELAAQGFTIEARAVKMAENIKEIGRYEVPVVLHDEVRIEIKVWVVEEQEKPAEPTAGAAAAAPSSAS
jgi:large subunit ribosomal protein L9